MKNKGLFKKISFYYLPLLAWMGLIFYLSSFPGDGIRWERDIWFYIERKGAHVMEFFILTILFIRIVRFYKVKREVYYISALFSLAYAFSDEIHQVFVIGREGKFSDIGVDLAGIILAVILYKLFSKKYVL